MPELIPAEIVIPEVAPEDPRLARWLTAERQVEDTEVVIIGFPSDEGVRRNGGRVGAAAGPHHIREALYRLTPDAKHYEAFVDVLDRTTDVGDVPVTGDLEADQERLGALIAPFLGEKTVVVLGGGHETTYGHVLGYVEAGLEADILNVDAHLDVRPLHGGRAHSGSPFRQALEHPSGVCARYRVAGVQQHSAARAHVAYVEARGGDVVYAPDLSPQLVDDLCAQLNGQGLVSFDLDAVAAADAPGVSAINPSGLDSRLWLHAAFRAGATPAVRSMDIVELNPRFDVDGRSARLAALTVWHFLRGLATRQPSAPPTR